MKSSKAKAFRPVDAEKTISGEKCWYCGGSADPGVETTAILTKPENDFHYFDPPSDEEKQIVRAVQVPRCLACRDAHEKVDNLGWSMLFYCLIGCVLLGVYLGIFRRTLDWWNYIVIGLCVSGAVIGIAVGIRRHFFMLPKNTKPVDEVERYPDVRRLYLKGWSLKR